MDFENEGPVLTLHRSSATRVITTVEFNDWTEQFSQAFMESADGASGDRSLDSMVRLFDTIQLRASNTSEDFAEDFDVTYRYACGRNRSPES